jgi:hypothetical protein
MSAHDYSPPRDTDEDASRTEQARRVIDEYAQMLRQVIQDLQKRLTN